ncbi:MAG: substrate-binding domain-containing protein [Clostridiales bacterium]|jgi:ABC-type sugar transport system substrate-binding protein|nr:substrate-binding domain-containing protein [Clostridiales bacterium]
MKKSMKKRLSLLLAGLLALAASTGCVGGAEAPVNNDTAPQTSTGADAGQNPEPTATAPEGAGTYKIGINYMTSASYVLVTLRDNSVKVIELLGSNALPIDDDANPEKIMQDIENMIASSCDGVIAWMLVDQMFDPLSELCERGKVPFVLNDKVPEDPATISNIKANPYFAGAIGPANAVYGESVAEYALAKGWKTVLILSGDAADPTDTPRILAFRAKFEAGGGIVLNEAHAASTADIQPTIDNALVAYPEPDFIYATGPDYSNASCDSLYGKGWKTKVLSSGLDSTSLERLADPDSPMDFLNGDNWVAGAFSAIILMNELDGNPLLDANGDKVWYTDIMPFGVPSAQYDLFKKFFIDEFMFTAEELSKMRTAVNPDFNYDVFMDVVKNYSLEERLKARYAEGKITKAEMDAAGIAVN